MHKTINIIQIGFGHMGRSFLSALLAKNKKQEIQTVHIVEKDSQRLKTATKIKGAKQHERITPDLFFNTGQLYLVLAIKPQDFDLISPELNHAIEQSGRKQDIVVLSMMAGITTANIAAALSCANVARIMPSLCVEVHTAVIALSFRNTEETSRKQLSNMLENLGLVVEISEEYISIITALSGSGIAFVLAFIDALGQAGLREGLALQDALSISQTVVEGAAKLLKKQQCSPRELIDRICSPAGTTVDGMYELELGAFSTTIKDAVHASRMRAEELSINSKICCGGDCSCGGDCDCGSTSGSDCSSKDDDDSECCTGSCSCKTGDTGKQ